MPRRMSAKPETQQAEVEREKRTVDREEWKEGSSFGNSGTELVDESVGGYCRLSRRRATSNTEQEGSREEKRETNGGEEGGEPERERVGGEYFSCIYIDIFMGVHRFSNQYGALISKRQNCI
ncbi:hypothetical protein ALC57_07063 [Trachymyrmex cornetzi]|uniref:Uncharacterized protein n=1 Tax=Trachymyrmex cornetzi TaxID=471704 RepID=A0A195E6V0_9HYME|nr:hypothetical protein ALC57_07063 [Trachymyrmex cornetzi]